MKSWCTVWRIGKIEHGESPLFKPSSCNGSGCQCQHDIIHQLLVARKRGDKDHLQLRASYPKKL